MTAIRADSAPPTNVDHLAITERHIKERKILQGTRLGALLHLSRPELFALLERRWPQHCLPKRATKAALMYEILEVEIPTGPLYARYQDLANQHCTTRLEYDSMMARVDNS